MSQLVFGKYEKLRRLAQGGMGEVFLARQSGPVGFERLVILKALREELAQDAGFREQFLDEARVAATLNHPNIVALYDVGEWEGSLYIAMEYIAGDDLLKLWYTAAKRGVGLPFQVSARIVHDACLGLDHAHHAIDLEGRPLHIVHRDVSPQNIMVRADGVTKLVDFGIAKAANRVSRTRAGTVKGKLKYMSPEQVKGEPLDGRSDQFSLGIVLWELCTGQRLFKADSELETLNKILQEPAPPPSTLVPGFPPELERVILRMLEKERSKRYPRLAAAARDLAAWLDLAAKDGEVSVADFVESMLGEELRARTMDLRPEATQERLHEAKKTSPSSSALPKSTTSTSPTTTATASVPRQPAIVVKRPDGTALEFQDAARLHQWILEGQLDETDLLANGDGTWLALGARPELTRFFELGRAMKSGALASAPPPAPPPSPSHDVAPAPPPAEPHLPRREPTPRPAHPIADDDGASGRGGGLKWLLAGAAATVVAVGGGLYAFDRPLFERVLSSFSQEPSSLAASELLFTTLPALSREDAKGLAEQASALAPLVEAHEPGARAAAALVAVERARAAASEAALLRLLGEDQARADLLEEEARKHRVAGYRLAQSAGSPDDALARLAMAAYQAERGALVELEADLAAIERALAGQDGAVAAALRSEARAQAALGRAHAALLDDDTARLTAALATALGSVNEALAERADDRRLALARLLLQHRSGATGAADPGLVDDARRSAEEATSWPQGALLLRLVERTKASPAPHAEPNARGDNADDGSGKNTEGDEGEEAERRNEKEDEPARFSDVLPAADKARRRGRCFEAAPLYRRALALDGSSARAHAGLGWCSVDLGRFHEAVRSFERATRLDRRLAEAQFGLAEALRFSGDERGAIEAYRTYLERFPTGGDAPVARNALEALR